VNQDQDGPMPLAANVKYDVDDPQKDGRDEDDQRISRDLQGR
jgi:hypothetical protein